MLRPMARCVDGAQRDAADIHLATVLERLARVLDLRRRVDPHRQPKLECQATVPRDVVGVRVRLENRAKPNVTHLRLDEQWFDREGWIDDNGETGVFVADEIGGAAEIVVDELREDHAHERSSRFRYRT